ncbi:MAG: 50S ribosomal protein L10 [Actinomycetia bacterium]|nr:50S ribosomal protein L10 [Actinomycetes bacterium]
MARPDKVAAVTSLQDKFATSTAAVLTDYRGLRVKDLKALRRMLGPDADYAIAKNTLTKLAAHGAGIEGLDDQLTGPTAIAFITGDVANVAKGLRDFAKANPLLIIKGGVMEGKTLDAAAVKQLADLESREVLLAKLAGAMKGGAQKAVSLFAAPLVQAAQLFGALQDKLGGPVADADDQEPTEPAESVASDTAPAAGTAAPEASDAAPATPDAADAASDQ